MPTPKKADQAVLNIIKNLDPHKMMVDDWGRIIIEDKNAVEALSKVPQDGANVNILSNYVNCNGC